MMRTHRAGDLRAEHIGSEVVICGWVAHRRDHGGVVFLDVRDTRGLVQVGLSKPMSSPRTDIVPETLFPDLSVGYTRKGLPLNLA